MSGLWLVSFVALWLLCLANAVVLLSVLRNLGVVYEAVNKPVGNHKAPTKLVPGDELPDIQLQTLAGGSISLASFNGAKTAFSVVSPQCGACDAHLREIANAEVNPDPLDPSVSRRVIVSLGDVAGTAELLRRSGFAADVPVLVDPQARLSRAWGITGTPTTVIVDAQRKVVRQVFSLEGDTPPSTAVLARG